MAVRLNKVPSLNEPVMLACWPGIGNVGLLAIDTIRQLLQAEEIGYIEPYEFFYPKKVVIRDGEMIALEFPASKFYYKSTEKRDLVFFVGEEQPVLGNRTYAEGEKAYLMANYVIDVAERLGCQRIYTSGAAVTNIHHTARSKVWAVPNTPALITEVKRYRNTVLMSQIETMGGHGSITGLNGLLLGVARKRNIDAICIMGEIPVYLQSFPILYPKGSKAVIELLAISLGIEIDLKGISEFAERSEREINSLYEKLPAEAKAQLDDLKLTSDRSDGPQAEITEDDKNRIMDELEKFFDSRGKGDEN